MWRNRLRAFPAAALADVAGTLQRLFMRDNDIASIAAGGLDGMTQLRRLELQGNALTSLPAGLFDDLTELRELKLNDNSIAALPDNLLRPLTKVEVVSLEGNPGFAGFAPVVEAIPAQSVERGARVDLEAVLGASPWGDNVIWSWEQTDTSGTTVTLDDADTTTPSFDAPSPNDERVLAFEATARGRGTSGGGASEGTRTAEVTVPGRASIVDVSVTSRPLDGTNTFKRGENIEITATFSEPVRLKTQVPFEARTSQFSFVALVELKTSTISNLPSGPSEQADLPPRRGGWRFRPPAARGQRQFDHHAQQLGISRRGFRQHERQAGPSSPRLRRGTSTGAPWPRPAGCAITATTPRCWRPSSARFPRPTSPVTK